MKTDTNYIKQITAVIDRDKQYNDKLFHKAKLLLKIYRDVVWRTQESMCEADTAAYEFGGRRIAQLADYLAFDFEGDIDKDRAEEKLLNIAESKLMIELVDRTLLRIKAYPEYGELFFSILTKKFIGKTRYTDARLIEMLEIERTQYYKRKKEAINLFGVVLWGYTLPPLKEQSRSEPSANQRRTRYQRKPDVKQIVSVL